MKKIYFKTRKGLVLYGIIIFILFTYIFSSEILIETGSDNNVKAIYSVDIKEKKIAISFDEGMEVDETDELLEVLDKYNAKATFFVIGEWVEENPDKLKKIIEKGHDIGNHTHNHARMTTLNENQMREEILLLHSKVKELTGYDMWLFRPPFGDYDGRVIDMASSCDYYTIKWNVDSYDWKSNSVDEVVNTVLNSEYLDKGSIILFHINRKYTKDAVEIILEQLTNDGYEIVAISDIIMKDSYYIDATGRQIKNEMK